MSDKVWTRDRFDVLLDDGTEAGEEHLGVTINYADRVIWAQWATDHKVAGFGDWRVDTAGTIWVALGRLGVIPADLTFNRLVGRLVEWEKVAQEPADPTPPAPGSGSPASSPSPSPGPPPGTGSARTTG